MLLSAIDLEMLIGGAITLAMIAAFIGLKVRPYLEERGWMATINPLDMVVNAGLGTTKTNKTDMTITIELAPGETILRLTEEGAAIIDVIEAFEDAAGLNN